MSNSKRLKKLVLYPDELSLLESIETGELQFKRPTIKRLQKLAKIAKNTRVRREVVTLRLSKRDVMRAKARAKQQGLPYQTFMASALHRLLSEDN